MYPPRTFKIQKPLKTDDGIGGKDTGWIDYITVYGYIDLASGTDMPNSTLNAAFVEESTHYLMTTDSNGVHIVPDSYIDDSMLVVDDKGRNYDITYVDDPVGVGHHLEIYMRYRR
jgi:hypothetical protein